MIASLLSALTRSSRVILYSSGVQNGISHISKKLNFFQWEIIFQGQILGSRNAPSVGHFSRSSQWTFYNTPIYKQIHKLSHDFILILQIQSKPTVFTYYSDESFLPLRIMTLRGSGDKISQKYSFFELPITYTSIPAMSLLKTLKFLHALPIFPL